MLIAQVDQLFGFAYTGSQFTPDLDNYRDKFVADNFSTRLFPFTFSLLII